MQVIDTTVELGTFGFCKFDLVKVFLDRLDQLIDEVDLFRAFGSCVFPMLSAEHLTRSSEVNQRRLILGQAQKTLSTEIVSLHILGVVVEDGREAANSVFELRLTDQAERQIQVTLLQDLQGVGVAEHRLLCLVVCWRLNVCRH